MPLTQQYKQFNVTFEETDRKYNPMTRTIKVYAHDEYHARSLVTSEFDFYRLDKSLQIRVPTGKHIKIIKIEEIKEKKTRKKKGK
ncbi:MAG: hypothetical protein WDA59_00025 [Methanofastidiosum sp.]